MSYGFYLILMLGVIIITIIAQVRVRSAYSKYSAVRNKIGYTGAQAAERILEANGIYDVEIVPIAGTLTDNYNPKTKVLSLSEGVYQGVSVAAISVAAHEVGHAIQHNRGYLPIKLRNALVPVANFSSRVSMWLILGGLLLNGLLASSYGNNELGYQIAVFGTILYASITLFHIITLPVELNASNRVKRQMRELGIIAEDERKGVRKMLGAAAMTYVASVLAALVSLLRIVLVVSSGRRR